MGALGLVVGCDLFCQSQYVVLSADRWAMEAWRCDGPFDGGDLHLVTLTWDLVNARFLSRELSALRGSETGCHLVEWFLDYMHAVCLQ